MAASSSLPVMGTRLGNRRLAALALCLVLLLHITTTTLVLSSNKGKGGGAKKGATQNGGGAQKRGVAQKGDDRKGGAPGTAGGNLRGVVQVGDAASAAGGSFRARVGGGAITYHGGPLMTGEINLSILFYGQSLLQYRLSPADQKPTRNPIFVENLKKIRRKTLQCRIGIAMPLPPSLKGFSVGLFP